MFRQPEHMLCKKKLRELCLFNIERRNFRANCPAVYKYPIDGYKEVKAGLSWQSHYGRTRGNRHKLQCLNMQKVFFFRREINHKEVSERVFRISSLGEVQNLPGEHNILKLDLFWTKGCTRWPLESPYNLHDSMILWKNSWCIAPIVNIFIFYSSLSFALVQSHHCSELKLIFFFLSSFFFFLIFKCNRKE